MNYRAEIHAENAIIRLSGKVTQHDSSKFIDIGKLINSSIKTIEVRLIEVDLINSVGVGMIITLAEHCRGCGCSVFITGVTNQIEEVFKSTKSMRIIEWDSNLVKLHIK